MSGPARVLHVVNGFGVGGVSSVVAEWTRRLQGDRFRFGLLVLSDRLGFLDGERLPDGVEVVPVPIPPPPDHSVAGYLKDGFLLGRARARGGKAMDAIRRFRPDLLHLHTVAQDLGIGILAARETGAALLFTDHLLRIRMDEYSPLVRGLLRVALRRLYRKAHLISVGRAVARANRASGFVGRGRRHLELPNRVDTERFRPRAGDAASVSDASSPVELVYVARIHRAKGQDTLVRACRAMRTRVPVRLTLVGPDETGGALEALLREGEPGDARGGASAGAAMAESAGRAGRGARPIRVLGPRFDVPDLLRASDIGVFPSYREGRPLALLEMMATGLPVVVSDIPELADMVRDGEDGLVVPAGDPAALAEALDRLVEDPALRVRLGRAARERVMREASGSNAPAVARFYEEVLGR